MNDPNKFDVLVDQISKLTLSMTTNTDTLNKLFRKVDDLEKTIAAKDQKIKELEERIDDLEQYSRKNNLVVNGLDLHRGCDQIMSCWFYTSWHISRYN